MIELPLTISISRNILAIIVGVFWLADVISSNITLRFMKKHKPKEWDKIEGNPLIRLFYKKGGITLGLIGSLLIGIISLFLIYYFLPIETYWILLGCQIVILIIHANNIPFIIKKGASKKKHEK